MLDAKKQRPRPSEKPKPLLVVLRPCYFSVRLREARIPTNAEPRRKILAGSGTCAGGVPGGLTGGRPGGLIGGLTGGSTGGFVGGNTGGFTGGTIGGATGGVTGKIGVRPLKT